MNIDVNDYIKNNVRYSFPVHMLHEDISDTSDSTMLPIPLYRRSSPYGSTDVSLIANGCSLTEDNSLTCTMSDASTTDDVQSAKQFTIIYGASSKCKSCRINFNSFQKLIDHVCATVPKCLVCDKVFKTQQKFVEHKNMCNKCLICDHCPARFHFEKSLMCHQVRQHNRVKPSVKPLNREEHHQTRTISEMSFASQMSPNSKRRSKSKRRKKSYECTSCSVSFPKLKRLNIHSFEVHGFQNKYASQVKCMVCAKYIKNYDDHMKRHLGILDYCCHMCDKMFSRAFDLEQHQKRCCCSVKI